MAEFRTEGSWAAAPGTINVRVGALPAAAKDAANA